MSENRRSSLTGSWSGAYRYPDDAFPETVFNAQIEEQNGAFFGAIDEPNVADPWLNLSVLKAEIEGTRSGLQIVFTKFYSAEADLGFAIRYEGTANEALTRIEGIWINPEWSGPFFMTRDDDSEAVAAEEEATIEVRR
ncbi:hypothetical protein [Terricaulis silvestris]|uniref:Uncharacterized protein n=1 Tax=Terricaulis silvestris TaxID=2686094 RepID=A0A6I6MNH0_9CAUL|nr:hypothetical protein [Terricaulis silvestris]QGZ95641.1 hypothetical protein DSM104635_02491 [Terricaulis silvestris]